MSEDTRSRKSRDAFLARFDRSEKIQLRQMTEHELPNGDVLEWYTYTAPGMMRAFIIQVYGHGNGIEVYSATMDNGMDSSVDAIVTPDVNYSAANGRRYCVRGPYAWGMGDSPAEAFGNAHACLPGFVRKQASKDKPITWQCFQVEAGCELVICEATGTVTWSPKRGAREANELLTGIVKGKHERIHTATEDDTKG